MRNKRSAHLFLLGAAVFVTGSGLAFAGLRSGAPAPATKTVTNAAPVAPAITAAAQAPSQPGIEIPKGKQAVAVDVPSVAGLGGYAKPGQLINVYATVKNATDSKLVVPQAKLVLKAVRILDVKEPVDGASASRVFLLALNESEAERLIFFSKFESLWFTLVPAGQTPASTGGRTYRNVL